MTEKWQKAREREREREREIVLADYIFAHTQESATDDAFASWVVFL